MICSLIFALLIASGAAPAPAPAPQLSNLPALELRGDLSGARSFTLAELQAMKAIDATWTAHGKEHRVRGVALAEVLTACGFTAGAMSKEVSKKEKLAGWKKIVVASAADGFQAVFSSAELFPEVGNTQALLAWELDGKPLEASQGPLRLIVLTDHEPLRSIYSLRTIELIDARDLHAGPR